MKAVRGEKGRTVCSRENTNFSRVERGRQRNRETSLGDVFKGEYRFEEQNIYTMFQR